MLPDYIEDTQKVQIEYAVKINFLLLNLVLFFLVVNSV